MTTLSYFPNSCARNSRDPLAALLDGAKTAGVRVVENDMSADWAVIWSVLWNGRMSANQEIYQHFKSQNKKIIVMDVGALYRNTTWKVALDNINANGYYGHRENLDWDRPRLLNLSLATKLGNNGQILIAAQHRNSLQLADINGNIEHWIRKKIYECKKYTNRPIVLRPHPRCKIDLSQVPGVTLEIPKKIKDSYDSFDMHFDFHTVINYNSGPGIQAAIEGCHVVTDSSSLAHPVSTPMPLIDSPPKVDHHYRDQWFVEICHTEYTLEELRKGLWLKRLSSRL